jgi:hypothetical protein
MTNFFNNGGFFWWLGCVEDRMDPLFLGRCRVRIVGFHDNDTTVLPVADLPWAMPMQPITSAAMSGIGTTPLGPVEGTWVIGFFRDGDDNQEPVMMGTVGGIPQSDYKLSSTHGFKDPKGQYPIPELLDEPDTNRLARNQGIANTIIQRKDDTRSTGVELSLGQGTWDEPKSSYNAAYPFNHVFQSESGHVVEFDDTADSERTHFYHKSGTFVETDRNGSQVTRIVGDNYEVLERNGFLYVKGKMNLTVEGSVNIYVKNNCNLEVDGNLTTQVHGNYDLNAAGKVSITAGTGIEIKTPTTLKASGGMSTEISAGLIMTLSSPISIGLKTALLNATPIVVNMKMPLGIPGIVTPVTNLSPSPVGRLYPSEPNFPTLGFVMSVEQRRSFTAEKIQAFEASKKLVGDAKTAALEYTSLKTEELDSNAVVSTPVKNDPTATLNTPSQYHCPVGILVVAAATVDIGIIETGSPPGLNYGGKVGGGALPEGVPGRIDEMLKLCGLDNQAQVKKMGTGHYWCAAAVTSWWKTAGLPVPSGPASCKNWESWAHAKGYFSATPKIGAAILYGTPGSAHHIGIVSAVSIDGQTITTIEGNTTGGGFNRNGCTVAVKNPRSYIGFVIPPPCSA